MSDKTKKKQVGRTRRHARVRRNVTGTAQRPRLAVFRSNRHVVAQVIDDRAGMTIAAASTLEGDLRGSTTSNCDAAAQVGQRVAERAKQAGIEQVVFDRGGFRYQGRVAALADAARAAGLEF
jgi:large subunit ribosomal protein L18